MLKSAGKLLSWVLKHPIGGKCPMQTVARVVGWQFRSRLQRVVRVPWIDGSFLVAERGMGAATGNIYCGLYECADMAFLLHLLGRHDLYADVGANIGSYTILASKVCGASSVAVEPCESTITALRRNITANEMDALVEHVPAALGSCDGEALFSQDLGTMNHVVAAGGPGRIVPMRTLDSVLDGRVPSLIKADVEGYEEQVLLGSTHTLSQPGLLAMELETVSDVSAELLAKAGFERVSYDPFERTLGAPGAFPMNNALFVRDREAVMSRVRAAPVRSIHGVRI